jgi:hypothetical protein
LTERSFLHLPKKKKHSGDLKIVAKLIYNPAEKSGVLTVENTCFLNSLFISSKKNGVHFDNNLLYLLPGKHTMSFQSEDLITIDDLVFEYL